MGYMGGLEEQDDRGAKPCSLIQSEQKSIGSELIVVIARNLGSGIGERRSADGRLVVEFDVFGVAVHKADVVDGIVVRNILIAKKVFVPGIAPMNGPLGHHDGA